MKSSLLIIREKETTYDSDSGEYIENRTLKMNAKNTLKS